MPQPFAAVFAFVVPLVVVIATLQGLRWYIARRSGSKQRPGAAVRRRRAQESYWLGASTIVGLVGVVATVQHFAAGKPVVLGTWVVAGAALGLLLVGVIGIALLLRRNHQRTS